MKISVSRLASPRHARTRSAASTPNSSPDRVEFSPPPRKRSHFWRNTAAALTLGACAALGAGNVATLQPFVCQAIASQPLHCLNVLDMNLGGGNEEARAHFDELRDRVAERFVESGAQVGTFQEMDVNTARSGHRDYNEEMLAALSQARQHGHGLHRLGTHEYVTVLADGRLSPIHVDAQVDGGVHNYTTQVGGETYSMTFGASEDFDGGQFGNSVLLGPEHGVSGYQLHDLGRNDADGENRTAIEVDSGPLRVFSAHLSSATEDKPARVDQYHTLGQLADGQPNVVIGADFNSHPGQIYGWHRYPTAGDLHLKETHPGGWRIDRVLVSQGGGHNYQATPGIEKVHQIVTLTVA